MLDQTKLQDLLDVEKLDEIILTEQYNPQSIKKSVFEVKVLNKGTI